jgi:hypothetical protein
MHFWLLTARFRPARGDPGGSTPWKIGLNWFMPALAKVSRSDGSFIGQEVDDATKVCPRCSKNRMKAARTSATDLPWGMGAWEV